MQFKMKLYKKDIDKKDVEKKIAEPQNFKEALVKSAGNYCN